MGDIARAASTIFRSVLCGVPAQENAHRRVAVNGRLESIVSESQTGLIPNDAVIERRQDAVPCLASARSDHKLYARLAQTRGGSTWRNALNAKDG